MYYVQPKEIEALEAAIDEVRASAHPRCLLIVRGLPGMGKSFLGRLMSTKYEGIQYESDQKFTTAGEYVFDPTRLQAAHDMTRHDVQQSMLQGVSLIVMSNTSTMKWEYEPYVQLAGYYQYTVILYDLYLQTASYMKNSLPIMSQTKHNVEALNEQYLRFLFENNVHSVPEEKIIEMSNRYQFQPKVIQVLPPRERASEEDLLSNGQRFVEVYDSGYYLSLSLTVAEDLTHSHSAVFWACILAGQELMNVFGISSAYQMIRKLVQRNLKSHSARKYDKKRRESKRSDGDKTAEDAWDEREVKKLIKQNAGWAKYHVTVLSPPEYDVLKKENLLENFVEKLNALRLDEINDQFLPLLAAMEEEQEKKKKKSDSGEGEGDLSSTAAYQQLIQRIGMLQGEIVDKSVSPAPLSEFSATLLNTYGEQWDRNAVNTCADHGEDDTAQRSVAPTTARETSSVYPAPLQLSSTFYLLLDKRCGVLQEIESLRNEVGVLTASHWQPHITLAFTHNDVHDKTSAARGESARESGLVAFERIKQFSVRKRKLAAERDEEDGDASSSSMRVAETDLTEDAPYPLLAELATHSEVQMSFSTSFSFTICDVKIRKGPFGDDESYRAHGVLMTLLPRGLVFLQHDVSRVVYRGIFSLKKFYGKEGMEDDGFGMSAGELNFKLQHQMRETETVVLMEKMNGRAGSCRFFSYNGDAFVIVGTKLAHTVGKVDASQRRIVLSDEYESLLSESVAEPNKASEDNAENESDLIVDYERFEFNRNKLIASNTLALSVSIKWDTLPELLQWSRGLTINGEVLDPNEMHLVVIDQLQWVVLCVTQFPDEELTVKKTETNESSPASGRQSLLESMATFALFFHFLPSLTEHRFASSVEETVLNATELTRKVQTTMQIAQSVIFERSSEGKVLYLLDRHGCVLEMMKYKTWWYIYRRSIREVVSKLLARYFKKEQPEPVAETSKAKRGRMENLQQRVDGMSRAKNKEKDETFQQQLEDLKKELAELLSPPATGRKRPLKPFVDDILLEIQRRWPNKFQFLKNEMPDVYESKVAMAISLAQSFVKFIQVLLVQNERTTVMRFRTQYPQVWEEFKLKENIVEDV